MPATEVALAGGAATVHYDLTGSGPALVLIHGTAASREQWIPLADALSGRFTVIAPDYSGSGDTVDAGQELTVQDLTAEILAAADAAGADRFHLVGHSLGAVVAAHLAATRPQRVASLVLHAGWAVTDTRLDAEFAYWLELLESDRRNATGLFARMLPLMAFGPRYWDAVDPAQNEELVRQLSAGIPDGTRRQTALNRAIDLRPLLPRITAPTLVLASSHDRIISPEQQQALVAAIPDSRYAEIDAGHGAPAEDPEAFIGKVGAFLDEHIEVGAAR